VSLRRLREPRGNLTAGQKSAEGVVDHDVGEASEALQYRKVEPSARASREEGKGSGVGLDGDVHGAGAEGADEEPGEAAGATDGEELELITGCDVEV
jgi:hypothetical protein